MRSVYFGSQVLRKTQLLLGRRHVERLTARMEAATAAADLAAASGNPRPDLQWESASQASAAASAAIQKAATAHTTGTQLPRPAQAKEQTQVSLSDPAVGTRTVPLDHLR